MGTPAFSVPALKALVSAGHEVASVYTQPPRPSGRGQKARPSPIAEAAETLGLPVRHPDTLKSPEVQTEFVALDADAVVVVAYGLLLPEAVLRAPRFGCFNIHASLLPRWRGAAPIHRAVMAGDTETGVSIMAMEAGLDTGPVLLTRRISIGPEDTTGQLHDQLAALGAEAMVEVLARLDNLTPVPQPSEGVTYAAKIDKAEARVDWTGTAEAVSAHIRGLAPFPGAWTELGDQRVKLLGARVVAGEGLPGETLDDFRIACGSGAVQITVAQRPGRQALAAGVFLRGVTLPRRLD